jgi:LysM repeat protein
MVLAAAVALWAGLVRSSEGAPPERSYVVQPYDTLWSIAAAHYAGDPREGVWKLRERNGLDGTVIRPGQRLRVPP